MENNFKRNFKHRFFMFENKYEKNVQPDFEE